MEPNQEVGVGIAGLGFGESVHLPALRSNLLLNPIGIWHHRHSRLIESSKINKLIAYKNWETLLQADEIKAIIIATPPAARFELAKSALEAGKHLLLEKPISLNSAQAEELARLAIKNRLSVAVDFEYRAVPLFMQLKKIIENNKLGKIWLVKFDWIMSSRANPKREWNWYSNNEEGGGVTGALGTHAIDILHWLIGPTENLSSQFSTSISERIESFTGKPRKVSSEDTCLAQLELCQASSNSLVPVQLTLSSICRHGRGCWIEIYGSEGTAILGSDNQKDYVHGFGLWTSDKEGPLRQISPDKDFLFKRSWSDGRIAPVERIQNWWAESIIKGTPVIPGLAEGIESQRVCDAIYESAKNEVKINLNKFIT